MSIPADSPLTELLAAAQAGDVSAQESVARIVYDELHGLAAAYLRRDAGSDATLQPTALVSEAYLRLLSQDSAWKNRSHFFGIAAQSMRRILVDHARHRSAQRRDRAVEIALDEAGGIASDVVTDVLGVHEALEKLATVDPRQAQITELKFFVGLTIEETASVLGISVATVSREWAMARVWLERELSAG